MVNRKALVQPILDKYKTKAEELERIFPEADSGSWVFQDAMIKDIMALKLSPDLLCPNAYENKHEASSWGNGGYCGYCYCPASYMSFGCRQHFKRTKEWEEYYKGINNPSKYYMELNESEIY